MAEGEGSEAESAKDPVNKKGFTAMPLSENIVQVELSDIVGGREELDDDGCTPDRTISSSVKDDVLEKPSQPYIHASSAPLIDFMELAQSNARKASSKPPSFQIQFTSSSGRSYSPPSHSTPHNTSHEDESITEPSLEHLLTPEEHRRGQLHSPHGSSGASSESGKHTPNQTSDIPVTRTLDSSTPSSAIPIAVPPISTTSPRVSPSQGLSGVSPYVMVKKGMVEASQYESPGLLYARSLQEKHNLDILRPADEVAEDVLETLQDVSRELSWEERDEGERGGDGEGEGERTVSTRRKKSYRKSHSVGSRQQLKDVPLDGDVPFSLSSSKELSPVDPNVLLDLEKQAHKIAANLDYIMDNLRNSLHAMTVCAKQSVMLHRESVDNLHAVVDTNVKATYSFLAKFEQLKEQTAPLNDLAQQIKDVNETLKILERNFRTP